MAKRDEERVPLTTFFEGTEEGSRHVDAMGRWPALLGLIAAAVVVVVLVLWFG